MTDNKINSVLKFYSLGKTHLCKIVGITRPTLYSWIKSGTSNNKIDQMYSLSKDIATNNSTTIFMDFIDYPLPGHRESLLDVFIKTKDLNTSYIRNYIKDAYIASVKREENLKKRNELSFKIYQSISEQELNLENNI